MTACSSPPPVPRVQLPELCSQEVRTRCGSCDPQIELLREKVVHLHPLLFTAVKDCANASLDSSWTLKDTGNAKVTLAGCIDSTRALEPGTRDTLNRIVESINVDPKKYAAWVECAKPTKKLKVVVMDSDNPALVYCAHTRSPEIGGSNAHDITNLLSPLGVAIQAERTYRGWNRDQYIIGEKPDLIIIHASAFYEKTQAMEGNKLLLDFIDNMLRSTQSRILVYTRGLPDQPPADILKRWHAIETTLHDPAVAARAQLFVMPKGRHNSCFEDREISQPFMQKVKEMLGLEKSGL